MKAFLQETIAGQQFQLLIDTKIYPKDIILKAAYNFLDKGYFLFQYNEDENIILDFTVKPNMTLEAEKILWDFSDELLDVYLRDKLERDNKIIRETIVTKALNGPLDTDNYVSLDTDNYWAEQNQIYFDKDIDQILKDLENDPDLKIDEEEIENILKEIEEETDEIPKPEIHINPDSISNVKEMFQKKE